MKNKGVGTLNESHRVITNALTILYPNLPFPLPPPSNIPSPCPKQNHLHLISFQPTALKSYCNSTFSKPSVFLPIIIALSSVENTYSGATSAS
uniref:Uncharacterized protein n=1 Tax=Ascaris lumbricoides TaxID=6252 RepID=A0A9J2PJI4_ASCLU